MLPPYFPLWLLLGLLGVIASGLVFAWVSSRFLRSKVGEIGGYVASGVASCIIVVRVVAALSMPAAERDPQTFHLWPLFTLIHAAYWCLVILAVSLVLTVLVKLIRVCWNLPVMSGKAPR